MNQKILVVDDDYGVLRLMERFLQREGYDVVTASNGLQALNIAKKEKSRLIILDLMLPGVDGFEVWHRLKGEPSTSEVPIMMVSVKAETRDKELAAEAGADVYVVKSSDSSELNEQIKKLIEWNVEGMDPRWSCN